MLSFFFVEIPRKCHIGQKLIKAVIRRIAATMNKMIAGIPEITLVKYKTNTNAAMRILTVLSINPIFDFIVLSFEI